MAEMSTGKALFPGDSEFDQIMKIFQRMGTPQHIGNERNLTMLPQFNHLMPKWKKSSTLKLGAHASKEFHDFVSHCLKMDPQERREKSLLDLAKHPFFRHEKKIALSTQAPMIPAHSRILLSSQGNPIDELSAKKMKRILVDWMIEVNRKFMMSSSTLLTSVDIIDRTLASKRVDKKDLQLLGISAHYLASLLHEVYPPDVNDFCFIAAKTYSKGTIIKETLELMSSHATKTWPNLSAPLNQLLLKQASLGPELREMSTLILAMLAHEPALQYKQDEIISVVLELSKCLVGRSSWAQNSHIRQAIESSLIAYLTWARGLAVPSSLLKYPASVRRLELIEHFVFHQSCNRAA